MRGKMRSGGGGRRRTQQKNEESDASDDDYKIEDDGELEDSDEYSPSLAGDELEDDLVEKEKKKKVNRRGRVSKAFKEREFFKKEESDEDFVADSKEEEDVKDWRTGFPKKKRNRVRKAVNNKKALYTEENDDEAEEKNDDGDYNGSEDDEDLQKVFLSKKNNIRKKKFAYAEEDDDDYEAEDDADDDDYDGIEDEKDLLKGCLRRKENGVEEQIRKKKASYMEESDDSYEAENDGFEEDDDCNDVEDEKDFRNNFPRRKRNGVQKKKNKGLDMEESDDNYEAEEDECGEENDYDDNEDEKDLRTGCPRMKQIRVQKKKNKASDTEESDDNYEAEEDECGEENDYDDNEDEKNLGTGCPRREQDKVLKKKNKGSDSEENDDDYRAEDDEVDDDYENEDDDEDFTLNEIDLDDDDEFVVVKKAKKIKRFSGGRKRRRNSRVINKSKRKEPVKRRGFQRKLSSSHCQEEIEGEFNAKKTFSGRKRRRLVVDSDSDFADSPPLLLDQEFTISEEEREQVREASKFCGRLDITLRNCSSKKRSEEEENSLQEMKRKSRKGKDKVEDSKNEVAKQVCGICFSEEGKRTIRGTLDCCSHYFCFNCIMEWSKVESRCPMCKQRFATITKPTRSDTGFDLRTTVIPVPERDQVYQPSEEELRSYLDPYENVICTECHHGGDDANMLLCDLCDSPAHTYCVGLTEVPEGNWYCEGCRPTALNNIGSSNPQTPNNSRDRRTNNNDLYSRSSPSVREAIDLNRVYEPEMPLAEETETFLSPRPADGDIRGGFSIPGAGVQTVRERRRRHQQFANFVGRNGSNIGLGPDVEWGRTRRLGFQNAIRPETSTFLNSFSQRLLNDNFTASVASHSRAHRVWGQTLAGTNGSEDGSRSLQARIMGGDAWSFHGHSPFQ